MKEIYIKDMRYNFVSNFKEDNDLRFGFNMLAKSIFNFDFEDYYIDGYWNNRYIPYGLLHDGNFVANVSVNILDFYVFGDLKRYIQIGTVMTNEAYRNKGLSKYLLEMVIQEWKDKSDMSIYSQTIV